MLRMRSLKIVLGLWLVAGCDPVRPSGVRAERRPALTEENVPEENVPEPADKGDRGDVGQPEVKQPIKKTLTPEEKIIAKRFFEETCQVCHNKDSPEGGIELDSEEKTLANKAVALDSIRGNRMPKGTEGWADSEKGLLVAAWLEQLTPINATSTENPEPVSEPDPATQTTPVPEKIPVEVPNLIDPNAKEDNPDLGKKAVVILASCLGCHRSREPILNDWNALRTGKSAKGAYINSENPKESLLIQSLRALRTSSGKSDQKIVPMPPKAPLPEETIATLEAWIAAGAPDPKPETAAQPAPHSQEKPGNQGEKPVNDMQQAWESIQSDYRDFIEPFIYRSCYDCHNSSHKMTQMFYTDWVIVKDIIKDHVDKGQKVLDFADGWPLKGTKSVAENIAMLDAIGESIQTKRMPLPSYVALPWYMEKKVNHQELQLVLSFIATSKEKLSPFQDKSL